MCSSAAGETKLSWFREKPRVPGQNRVVDTTNDAFGSDKCLDCQSGATSRPPRRENRACGGSDSSSNVLVVTPERHSCRVVARAKRERTLEAEWVRAPHKNTREVHVRNTSRVASPTPFGVQKQNWRVRRLVSSRRGPPFFASGGTHRSRRPGRWVWRAGCAMVAEARPTLYHDVYQRRDRNRATLRGAHPRTTARWRPQKCRRRRKARRFSRSVWDSRLAAPAKVRSSVP